MAKIPNAVEILPKITNRLSWVHERYRRQTDRRQTDGRQHIANVSSRLLKTSDITVAKQSRAKVTTECL